MNDKKEMDIRFKLLLKRIDNVVKVVKKHPKMSMFNQSKIINKLNKNLYYKGGK
jgi:transcriptional regulator NrdR family protein